MPMPAARKRGPACACCGFPVRVRGEIARRGRAGATLKSISDWAVNEGYPVGRDAVGRHLRNCVKIDASAGDSSAVVASVLVARTVALALEMWPNVASELGSRLTDVGLPLEGDIVQSHLPEANRRALAVTVATPAGELLEARNLAVACRAVFTTGYPDAARAIADHLAGQGADELAEGFRSLADRARENALHAAKARTQELLSAV